LLLQWTAQKDAPPLSSLLAEHMKLIALILFTIVVPMTVFAEDKVSCGKGEEQEE
jgi:hypothetical protein